MSQASPSAYHPSDHRRHVIRRLFDALLQRVDKLDPTPRIPRRLAERKVAIAIAASVLAMGSLLVFQLVRLRSEGAESFDWMLVSGYATVIVGLWAARGQGGRFLDAARRLSDRGALVESDGRGQFRNLTRADVDRLAATIAQRARDQEHRSGVFWGLGAALLFAGVHINDGDNDPISLLVLAAALAFALISGYLVGRTLRRLAGYGWRRSPLAWGGRELHARAGHPDGAAGLKPLGDFYFSQAVLLALPCVFLATWIFLLTFGDWDRRYGDWRLPYEGLLILALAIQVLLFLAPMWTTHIAMQQQKKSAVSEADALGPEISELQEHLLRGDLSEGDRGAARDRLDSLLQRYRELDQMPTWPVDPSLRRRFGVQALAFSLPLVADAAKAALGL